MTKRFSIVKLLKQPGFTFVGQQFCNGRDEGTATSLRVTQKIYATLFGGNPKHDEHKLLQDSAKTAVTKLIALCIDKKQLFNILQQDTVFQAIIEEWKPNEELEPSHVRLILGSYISAREKYVGSKKSELASLVDEFKDTWHAMEAQGKNPYCSLLIT